jgi:hypothetical protein
MAAIPTVSGPALPNFSQYLTGALPGTYGGGGFQTGGAGNATAGNPYLTLPQSQLLQSQGQTQGSEQNTINQILGGLAQGQQTGQFGLANTQQQGYNQLANTGLAGQYGLAGTGLQTQAGIEEAQIGAMPNLINSAIGLTKFNALFPYQQQILGQIGPLIGDIGGFLGRQGDFAGGAVPGTTAQGTMAPGSMPTVSAPTSVINPAQAQAMMAGNTAQGNQGAVSDASALGLGQGNSPLDQQLMQQLSAQNSQNLSQAGNQFQSQLTPANAQQGLSAAQLAELNRSQQAQLAIGRGQAGAQRLGGLANYVGGLTRGLGGL